MTIVSPPLLSIITPAYNVAAYLPPLIDAVLQTALQCHLEWIVIDDGSTDETAEIIATQCVGMDAVRLIRQENVGLAETRNRGLAAARGEYVWFVDGDDLIAASAMPLLVQAMAESMDMIGFQAMRFSDHSNETPIYRSTKMSRVMKGETWWCAQLLQKEGFHFAWIYLHRRQFLRDVSLQFKRGILHEDVAFTTEAVLQAEKVRYVDVVAYRYRLNPASLTGSLDDSKLLARAESYFVIVSQLRDINRRIQMQPLTRNLLDGEVVGQALQLFEVAKQLSSMTNQQHIRKQCVARRFAQSLFAEVHNYKRFRQVVTMWLKQVGVLPMAERK